MSETGKTKPELRLEGVEDVEWYVKTLISGMEEFYEGVDSLLDCGAGSGTFTFIIAAEFSPSRIFSYDGYYVNFDRMLRNRAANSAFMVIPDDHHIHGNTGRKVMSLQSGIVNDMGIGEPVLLETRSVDDLVLPRLDLIRISVPGAAMEIIKGGVKKISEWNPRLIVELVSPAEERDVTSLLEGWGYRMDSVRNFRTIGSTVTRVAFFSHGP